MSENETTDDGIEPHTRVGHCKADPFDIYIGRGAGGRDMLETPIGKRGWLGNPHSVDDYGREGSIERFRTAFEYRLENDLEFRARVRDLAGKRLGCWCQRLDEDEPACHGEVIAEHADRLAREGELVTDGGVDTAQSGWGESVWSGPERNENAPKRCPHCDRPLAHPEDIRDNDNIAAYGLFSAYREHRQAHFSWGDDPREHGERYGDPYLGNYYDTSRDATYEPDEDEPAGDPDEVVGHVFDVDIRYEATVRARVVAPDKQRAKEKAEDLRIVDGEDLNGNVPEARLTTQLHTDTTERENVHRADTDLAERMEGWPW